MQNMEQITDIRQQQLILNDILQQFKVICVQHNLTYWLSNGTLLGAVKYKGFIPWDDDIDVMMPRSDYEKLVNLNDSEFNKYTLLCAEKHQSWKYPYAKLSDGSTIVHEGNCCLGLEYGLAIDIFPIDYWCGDYQQACRQAKFCQLICRFLYTSTATSFKTKKKGVKKFLLYIIYIISKIVGSRVFFKALIRQSKRGLKPDGKKYIGSVCWPPYGTREVLRKEWFESFEVLEFENECYPIPSGYQLYLKSLYGDYKSDLPINKRVSNHSMIVWKK